MIITNPWMVFGKKDTRFIFTVDTTKAGSASNQFILPTSSGGYDFSINWGDNIVESYDGSPGNITHTYGTSGIKTISISGVFPLVRFSGATDRLKLVSVDQWGDYGKTNTIQNNAFNGCSNLILLPNGELDVFKHVISFTSCFAGTGLTSFPNYDLSSCTNFIATWQSIQWSSFPLLNISPNADCSRGWRFSFSLVSFPAIPLPGNQAGWFQGNPSLTTMPPNLFDNNTNLAHTLSFVGCAFNQQSVDNILVSFNTSATNNNLNNGQLTINGGSSATPSATGQAATDALRARGWTVSLNGY